MRPDGIRPYVVRGHPLDAQQMAAVACDSPTQLVVAGAGTGKTTTLIGKVMHLVDRGVDPSRILMISLTNNTVADLRRAVDAEFGEGFPADIMTIHALGNRILRRRACVGRERLDLLRRIMYDLVEEDRSCARAMMLLVEGMRTAGSADVSLNGTVIRNRGLRNIADALFECGVRCEYSRPSFSGKDMKPASIHADDGDGHRLVLTSDDEPAKAAGRDAKNAWTFISDRGFRTDRMNVNDLAASVVEAWGERIPEYVGMLISRCKCTRTTIHDLLRANGRNPTSKRASVEERLHLLDRVWDIYTMECIRHNLADYDDMVIQAAELIRAGRSPGKAYEWVLVDEYQDVSRTLVDLLDAIRGATGFGLFCVGDDWQSIYAFSGGDVWQMYDFENIWKGYGGVSVSRIERTYRSPQQIVDMTSRFVMRNPMQQRKDVKGVRTSGLPPVQLLPVNNDKEISRMVANRLDFLDPSETVFVIGRTRNDVYALGQGNGQFLFSAGGQGGSVDIMYRRWSDEAGDWFNIRPLRFLTAHSSKGLEADNVFLIADRDRGGFPSTVSDDIGDLFEARNEGIPFPEERRVFYVAMTRARKRLFMVNRMEEGYALSSETPFMREIIEDNGKLLTKSTPFCSQCYGPMRIVEYNGRVFYGCCDYPACGSVRKFPGL
ncbi:MAG: ATP-dependent helicase [Thermoplasmata archaeon]|nr:ATP-dependent helicase [Thermoplasmata archaeon]